jgi:hypothetical protein
MKNRSRLALAALLALGLALGCATANPIDEYPFILPDVAASEEASPPLPLLSRYAPPFRPERFIPGTPGHRLRPRSLLVVGDSLSVGLGVTIGEALEEHGEVAVFPEGKIGSGLNSPSFFNWEEKLDKFIAEHRPDVLVVLIGGNDAHNGTGSEEWAERFRDKVQNFLQIASAHDVLVYWVELPPMKDKRFNRNVKVANRVMESVCSKIGNCNYVPTWNFCAGDKEDFAVRAQVEGAWVMLRVDDGAHFTHDGYRVLSRQVLKAMVDKVDLTPPPMPEESDSPEGIEGLDVDPWRTSGPEEGGADQGEEASGLD